MHLIKKKYTNEKKMPCRYVTYLLWVFEIHIGLFKSNKHASQYSRHFISIVLTSFITSFKPLVYFSDERLSNLKYIMMIQKTYSVMKY